MHNVDNPGGMMHNVDNPGGGPPAVYPGVVLLLYPGWCISPAVIPGLVYLSGCYTRVGVPLTVVNPGVRKAGPGPRSGKKGGILLTRLLSVDGRLISGL